MLTTDQKYAVSAHKHVQNIHDNFKETEAKKYGALAHKLPLLIHSAGLAQALAFIDTRAKDPKNAEDIQKRLLNDLAITVNKKGREELLKSAREAELVEYILLTRQIMNALLWYKRFAQSILNVDVADSADMEDILNGG